ncbi:MAG: hypothetical protein ACKOW9_00060 [Candidatus Paceibacterota bacterium]
MIKILRITFSGLSIKLRAYRYCNVKRPRKIPTTLNQLTRSYAVAEQVTKKLVTISISNFIYYSRDWKNHSKLHFENCKEILKLSGTKTLIQGGKVFVSRGDEGYVISFNPYMSTILKESNKNISALLLKLKNTPVLALPQDNEVVFLEVRDIRTLG